MRITALLIGLEVRVELAAARGAAANGAAWSVLAAGVGTNTGPGTEAPRSERAAEQVAQLGNLVLDGS